MRKTIIAITVVAILGSLLLWARHQHNFGKIVLTHSTVQTISTAIGKFIADFGRCPTGLYELTNNSAGVCFFVGKMNDG